MAQLSGQQQQQQQQQQQGQHRPAGALPRFQVPGLLPACWRWRWPDLT
jgi:hypothetical protein